MLDKLDKVPLDEIAEYRRTGNSQIIPIELQKYITQLDRAVELFRVNGNISTVAKTIMAEFANDKLSFNTARNRVYDAINMFYLNNTVKNLAWDMYYADKFEDLARVALAADNITEARRCFEKARELKTKHDESAYDPEKLRPAIILVGPDYNNERLGIGKYNKKELWPELQQLIKNVPDIGEEDKTRLLNETALELGIDTIDIDYEDDTN